MPDLPGLGRVTGLPCGRPVLNGAVGYLISMVWRRLWDSGSRIKIWFSVVTTAIQPVPKVTAWALVPAGRVISAGRLGPSADKRMTSRLITTTSPPIITTVNVVTRRRRNLSCGGSS